MRHIKNTMLSVGLLHVDVKQNIARDGELFTDDADKNDLIRKLFPGWRFDQPNIVVREMVEGERKAAKEHRAAFRKMLETVGPIEDLQLNFDDGTSKRANASQSEILRTFDELYKETPKYMVKCGNRRATALFDANCCRLSLGMPYISEVPVSIMEFENATEEARMNIMENERRYEGALDTTWKQKVSAAKYLYEAGDNQSKIRNSFGHGNGQKLWWFLVCATMFKALNLLTKVKGGELNIGQTNYKSMKEIAEKNDEAAAALYFAKPKADGNAAKMTKRDRFEALSKQSPLDRVRAESEAVLADTLQDYLTPLNGRADLLNLFDKIALGLSDAQYKVAVEKLAAIESAVLEVVGQ